MHQCTQRLGNVYYRWIARVCIVVVRAAVETQQKSKEATNKLNITLSHCIHFNYNRMNANATTSIHTSSRTTMCSRRAQHLPCQFPSFFQLLLSQFRQSPLPLLFSLSLSIPCILMVWWFVMNFLMMIMYAYRVLAHFLRFAYFRNMKRTLCIYEYQSLST